MTHAKRPSRPSNNDPGIGGPANPARGGGAARRAYAIDADTACGGNLASSPSAPPQAFCDDPGTILTDFGWSLPGW